MWNFSSTYHTADFLVVHNGSGTFNTEYAIIKTNDSLATFDTDINGDNVRLLVTPASDTSTTFKVKATAKGVQQGDGDLTLELDGTRTWDGNAGWD